MKSTTFTLRWPLLTLALTHTSRTPDEHHRELKFAAWQQRLADNAKRTIVSTVEEVLITVAQGQQGSQPRREPAGGTMCRDLPTQDGSNDPAKALRTLRAMVVNMDEKVNDISGRLRDLEANAKDAEMERLEADDEIEEIKTAVQEQATRLNHHHGIIERLITQSAVCLSAMFIDRDQPPQTVSARSVQPGDLLVMLPESVSASFQPGDSSVVQVHRMQKAAVSGPLVVWLLHFRDIDSAGHSLRGGTEENPDRVVALHDMTMDRWYFEPSVGGHVSNPMGFAADRVLAAMQGLPASTIAALTPCPRGQPHNEVKPEAAQPEAAQPEAAQPEAAQPEAAQPEADGFERAYPAKRKPA